MKRILYILTITFSAIFAFSCTEKKSELEQHYELALLKMDAGEYAQAEKIFRNVLYGTQESKDTLLEAKCLSSYAKLCVLAPKPAPESALEMLKRVANELRQPLTPEDRSVISYSYALMNNKENALKWSRRAISTSKESDKIAKEKNNTTVLISGIVILALLIIIFSLIWYERNERLINEKKLDEEKEEREKYMNLAEELELKISSIKNENGKTAKSKTPSFAKIGMLDKLCEQFYVYEGTENLQDKILKEVKNTINSLRENDEVIKELETALDNSSDGIVKKFRKQLPNLKNDDIKLFILAASGFSSTAISAIIEKDKGVVYNRIWRLKGKISASEAENKEEFIDFINH